MSKRIDEKSLEIKVPKFIKENELIENEDKLILGVSGGPDSLCMLDLLYKIKQKKELNFEIIVAHVNHMIREEAESDENFVKEFCRKRNIEFISKKIDIKNVANTEKIGLEEAGRKERYKFFDEILAKKMFNKIAIAHNKNDVAETILMNIFRGTGITGLKGIEAKTEKYIRPLLNCERSEIEKYCKENNLTPRIDKTNFENTYTRNKIRNIVIPYIQKEFNPNIIETMYRLSNLVKEEETYIKKEVQKKYTEILISEDIEEKKSKQNSKEEKNNEIKKQIILDLKKFNLEEKVIKSELIIYTITRLTGSNKGIEKIHIEDIIKLCQRNIGNKFLTPNKHLKIFITKGQIYFQTQN